MAAGGGGAGGLRAGRAVIEVSLVTRVVERQLRQMKTRLQTISSSFSKIGMGGAGGIGGLASLRNLFIGSAAAAAAAWPLKLAANMEVATAQLAIFTGGEDKARAILKDLQRFSSVAMLPVDNLTAAAGLLLRFGIQADRAAGEVKALTVVAAGNSEEFDKLALAYAQVARAGHLTGEEERQLKNTAFNPLQIIAEKTGETMDELRDRMEAGGISFNEVSAALQSAVGPGGKFHGLLERIAQTLMGQWSKAWAKIREIAIAVGDEMLEPFTNLMKAINGALPFVENFVKKNIKFVHTVLKVGAAVGLAVVVIGLFAAAMGMLVVIVTGVSIAWGALVAAVGLIISPIGLIIAGLVALATWFLRTQAHGKAMVTNFLGWFKQLADVAKQTFGGIVNALKAGQLDLAMEVAIAGMKVAWLTGIHWLGDRWTEFKDTYLRITTELVFAAQRIWVRFSSWLKDTFTSWTQWAGKEVALAQLEFEQLMIDANDPRWEQINKIKKLLTKGYEAKAAQSSADIAAEEKAELAKIDKDAQTASKTRTEEQKKEMAERKKELEKARKKLGLLTDQAQAAADATTATAEGVTPLKDLPFDAAAAGKTEQRKQQEGVFDTRLARQMFGITPDRQLEELRQINKNTRRLAGLPVV